MVQRNFEAVDQTLANLTEVKVPEKATSALSRRHERESDRFAVELTGMSDAMASGMDWLWFVQEIAQRTESCDFEPLVTTKQLGLGLGLTTARALVENQGGTLRCENQPGVGARFVLRFPALAAAD